MGCPHLENIDYGKCIQVDPTNRILHTLCTECGAVGTTLEVQDENEYDPDHWETMTEIWHEPRDYWREDLAKDMVIRLMRKGETA